VRSDKTMDDVRIICMSGMVEEDKIEDLKASGANEFIHKPFEVETLIERMCHLLDIESVTTG
jgi:DNA-binding response OmpR family regulator